MYLHSDYCGHVLTCNLAGNKGSMYSSADNLSGGTPRRSLSAMHRSKVTPAQSMVNLSNSNSSLYGALITLSEGTPVT